MLKVSQEATLHPGDLVDQGDHSISFKSVVAGLVTDHGGELEVKELEESSGDLDNGLGTVGHITLQEFACEESGETLGVHAGTHDEFVSVSVVAGNAAFEAVLGSTEVLVRDVIVVIRGADIVLKHEINGPLIVIAQAIEGLILLLSYKVGQGEKVAWKSVDIVEANFAQCGHILFPCSGSCDFGATSEAKESLSNSGYCGKYADESSELLHLIFFNIIIYQMKIILIISDMPFSSDSTIKLITFALPSIFS